MQLSCTIGEELSIYNRAKDKGIKLTEARKEILNILTSSQAPLSYEDIKDKISMDKATFYRNISNFEQKNIINCVESHDKKRYFEIKNNAHAHFACKQCNKIECISTDTHITLPGYFIENIIIQGICSKCTGS